MDGIIHFEEWHNSELYSTGRLNFTNDCFYLIALVFSSFLFSNSHLGSGYECMDDCTIDVFVAQKDILMYIIIVCCCTPIGDVFSSLWDVFIVSRP